MTGGERLTYVIPMAHLPASLAPVMLVKALAYDRDEGFEMQIRVGGSPQEAGAAVGAGQGDVTFFHLVFGFFGREHGRHLKAFYSYARGRNRSFSVPLDSTMKTLADLRGKTIGLHSAGTKSSVQLTGPFDLARAVLRDEGIDPDRDVRLAPLPGSPFNGREMAEAVRTGKVDAVWQLDFNNALFDAEGLPLRALSSRVLDHLTPVSCLFTTDQYLAKHADLLGRLGRAVAKATVFAMTNPEATVRLAWQHVPQTRPAPRDEAPTLKRDLASLSARLQNQRLELGREPRWGAITEEEVANWQGFLLRAKAITQRRAPREYYTGTLIEQFNDFDASSVAAQARGLAAGPS